MIKDYDSNEWVVVGNTIQSSEFLNDISLTISGDFETPTERNKHAQTIADKLNGKDINSLISQIEDCMFWGDDVYIFDLEKQIKNILNKFRSSPPKSALSNAIDLARGGPAPPKHKKGCA